MMLAQTRLAFGINDAALRERIEQKFAILDQYLMSED
jgi:hypothetical protein